MEGAVTVAREVTPHGEVALRRRGEVLELVVDGAFAMDTVDTSTERLLASVALAEVAEPRRVLDGGLGLGFTARAVLADPRVEHLDVVELAEPLVRWARESLVSELAGLEGPRCALHVADVLDVLHGRAGPEGPWDLVLLDVDNGPDFLVHAHNAALYDGPALAAARAALRPGGALVVWSSHRAPALLAGLEAVAGDEVAELVVVVEREGRSLDYALYRLRRPA
ncbi:spermine/spermidine synthase [Phycicoccus sp. SLBN-51]|nr:spermine/spermidine synthase [Phycicoccus sp. SLBN-51]